MIFVYIFILFLIFILFYRSNKYHPEYYSNHNKSSNRNHPTITSNDININNQRQSTDYYEFNDYTAPYPFSYYDNINNNIFGLSYHPNNHVFNGNYKTSKKCANVEINPDVDTISETNFYANFKINDVRRCNKILDNDSAGAYKTFI